MLLIHGLKKLATEETRMGTYFKRLWCWMVMIKQDAIEGSIDSVIYVVHETLNREEILTSKPNFVSETN